MASKLENYKIIQDEMELQLARVSLDIRWANKKLLTAKAKDMVDVLQGIIRERKQMAEQIEERLEILNVSK